MSSSNNAYKIAEDGENEDEKSSEAFEQGVIDSIKRKNVMRDIDTTQLSDSMIALTYVISDLENKKEHAMVMALRDILEIHHNTKNLLNRSTQEGKDEYESVVFSYFAIKYFDKIKLDKYKEDVRKKINT